MPKQAYVFQAKLEGWPGVRRTVAVRAGHTLVDLHGVLQTAFDWDDDHLYAFWLDGRFSSRKAIEYIHPMALESSPISAWGVSAGRPPRKSARARLDRLRLTNGQRIAYLFDFGDEWHVSLLLRDIVADDEGEYPRILDSVGDAPPQYPPCEDDEEAA